MMMGTKERRFAPLANPSLEDLVPADPFYRHLERTLDLAFVRELVRDRYATGGRPSVDPVVFFTLQLVMFFEGLRSERQLMQVVADRLSLRWYLGYDLDEPLPDHSSLTRIRDRYGLAVFRRFFAEVVGRCQAAGLVWGQELYIDATKVEANASIDSVLPRFAVEAHLDTLFAAGAADDAGGGDSGGSGDAPGDGEDARDGAGAAPAPLPVAVSAAARTDLEAAAAQRHDWRGQAGRPDRDVIRGGYRRTADFRASATDPDAALMRHRDGGLDLGYQDHSVVDGGKARIVLAALAAPAEVQENQPALDLLWWSCFRWQVRPRQVSGDTAYGTREIIVALEDAGIRAYVPLPDFDHRTPFFGRERFSYDPVHDSYRCPSGQPLPFRRRRIAERIRIYQAPAAVCNACPLKGDCTGSARGRQVRRSEDEAYRDRGRGYHATEPYRKAMRKRQVWVEPLFAEAKAWHGLRRFRLRGLPKVNAEALLIATGQNLKRLLSWRGWGRRPWPSGAPGLLVSPLPAVSAVVP